MIYLCKALFCKDLDPWGFELNKSWGDEAITAAEEAISASGFSQHGSEAFIEPAAQQWGQPCCQQEPFVLPPGSATARVSGAAWREVWEVQVWRLWSQPKPYSSSAGQILTITAAAYHLFFNFTEGRRLVSRAL